MLLNILSWVPPDMLLPLSLVCKRWSNIIKSTRLWWDIHKRIKCKRKSRRLPWYVYYSYHTTNNFKNLIKNGNGQQHYKHWKVSRKNVFHRTRKLQIEDPPRGTEPLPKNIPDFDGHTSCFVTSSENTRLVQEIPLFKKHLLCYIMTKFKPRIYCSAWMASRFDNESILQLIVKGYSNPEYNNDTLVISMSKEIVVHRWEGGDWHKIEIAIDSFPKNLAVITFEHGNGDPPDTGQHYSSSRYRCKMAGGVVQIDFDSIQGVSADLKKGEDMDC
ncbi:unnamed protein product [Acanthoscelides obtectus]|nr:unnamed protein product [Acanthoscelides obtectus]CAK1623809.1 F-box only protein 6 [Acanthoscelides obtectus]